MQNFPFIYSAIVSLSKPPFSSGISHSFLLVYLHTLWCLEALKLMSNTIQSLVMIIYLPIFPWDLLMLPWLLIAIYIPWISQISTASGVSALHRAASEGRAAVAEKLISAGAKVEATTGDGASMAGMADVWWDRCGQIERISVRSEAILFICDSSVSYCCQAASQWPHFSYNIRKGQDRAPRCLPADVEEYTLQRFAHQAQRTWALSPQPVPLSEAPACTVGRFHLGAVINLSSRGVSPWRGSEIQKYPEIQRCLESRETCIDLTLIKILKSNKVWRCLKVSAVWKRMSSKWFDMVWSKGSYMQPVGHRFTKCIRFSMWKILLSLSLSCALWFFFQ